MPHFPVIPSQILEGFCCEMSIMGQTFFFIYSCTIILFIMVGPKMIFTFLSNTWIIVRNSSWCYSEILSTCLLIYSFNFCISATSSSMFPSSCLCCSVLLLSYYSNIDHLILLVLLLFHYLLLSCSSFYLEILRLQ